MKTCPAGQIKINTYKTKNGHTVKAHCRRDVGKPGKGKRLFTLKKGDLTKYGYSLKLSKEKREKSIKKAMNTISKNSMIRKLNALRVLNKNTNPLYSSRAHSDMKYVQDTYK